MTNPNYTRSTDGDNADDASTWALANATLVGAMTDSVAGDRTWVSQAHAETTAAAVTITMPGGIGTPNQIICGDDAAEPPTALATTATVSTTGASAIAIRGSGYLRGLAFSAGSAASNANLILNDTGQNVQMYESCDLTLGNTHPSSSLIQIGGTASAVAAKTFLKNCRLKVLHTGQFIATHCKARLSGVSFISGTSTPAAGVFGLGATSNPVDLVIEDSDFTNLATTFNVFRSVSTWCGKALVRGCTFPASWAGNLMNAAISSNSAIRVELYNCMISGGAKMYEWIEDAFGTLRDSQTIYRTGGQTINGVPLSKKMTTSANAKYPASRFESNIMERPFPGTAAEVAAWTPGASVTVTAEFVHDTNVAAGQGAGTSFAFMNDEWALEVQVLDSSGSVISTTISSAPATVITAAADIASSSEAWTTAGLTTPVKQAASVTIAPQEPGTIVARWIGYKASKTIYACGKITVA